MYGQRPYGDLPFGAVPDGDDSFTRVSARMRGVATGRFTIHANSGAPFITGEDDSPRWAAFDGGLLDPITFRWAASAAEGIVSGFGAGDGAMILDNADGQFSQLAGAYGVGGQDHEIRLGRPGVPVKDWYVVFRGTARGLHVAEREVRIQLADYGYRLDQPLQPNTFAGTGGGEGGADLKGKPKPRTFGYCSNVSPVLADAPARLYVGGDRQCQAIPAVYVDGVQLASDGDYPTIADLLAAEVTPGRFATCLAVTAFRLHYELPNTGVTADIHGESDGGFSATLPQIVRRMALTRLPASSIYEPAFAAYAAVANYEAGYHVSHESQATVREAIAQLLGAGSFAFFTRMGKLAIARLTFPSGPPLIRLDDADIISVAREELPDLPPPFSISVGYDRNWTPKPPTIAEIVSDERRAWLAETLRYATAEDPLIRAVHGFSQSRRIDGYLRSQAAAQEDAEHRLALHRRPAAFYRVKTRFKGYRAEQGAPAFVRSDRERWLARGRLGMVIDRGVNGRDKTSEIVMFA